MRSGMTADEVPMGQVRLRQIQDRYLETSVVVPGHGAPGGPELFDHAIAIVEAHRELR
jgi:hypothetical protein